MVLRHEHHGAPEEEEEANEEVVDVASFFVGSKHTTMPL